jgi:hypothetical protein
MRVKVRAGPGEFSSEYEDIRSWFRKEFDVNAVFEWLRNSRESVKNPDSVMVTFWVNVSRIFRVHIVQLVKPIVGKWIEEPLDEELETVIFELVVGLHIGLRSWPNEEQRIAVDEIIKPVFEKTLWRSSEISSALVFGLTSMTGDCDARRNLWLLDIAGSLVESQDEALLRKGLFLICILAVEWHPQYHPLVCKFIEERVLPRVNPLSEISVSNIQSLAHLIAEPLVKGVSRLWSFDFVKCAATIFDLERERAPDHVAVFLGALKVEERRGRFRFAEWMADRIKSIFSLRNDVTRIGLPAIKEFYTRLGLLDWGDKLDTVITALSELYPVSQWFVQREIICFMYAFCFSHIFSVPKTVHKRIFEKVIPLFVSNDNSDLRKIVINNIRLLIPIVSESREEFWLTAVEKESRLNLAAANGLALLGSHSVLNGCPPWLVQLFQHLESAHKRVPPYAKAIEAAFGDFWKKVGPEEMREIEDFRYVFSGEYYS